MSPRHRVSRAALELLKRFEGYRRTAAQLPDGRWTIGHGHTLTAREGAVVSESDAEALLLYDLITVAHVINENVYTPITQNQFDALNSFAFNIGIDNFRQSQVLKRLNAGALVQAACAMELWRKADFQGERIVIDALVRRRAAEKALFLTPQDGIWIPAPSPILRPAIDLDALDLVPPQRPVEVDTDMQGDLILLRRSGESGPPSLPLNDEPTLAVTAAAAAVTARLETLLPDPGQEPQREATEPSPPTETDSPDVDLDIPKTPFPSFQRQGEQPTVNVEVAPFEFIPARKRPTPRRREASIVWDLLLILLGLVFFGFAVFWGLYAQPTVQDALVTPIMVAWPAGLAGIGFVVVAVFRLLQRLGREVERD